MNRRNFIKTGALIGSTTVLPELGWTKFPNSNNSVKPIAISSGNGKEAT